MPPKTSQTNTQMAPKQNISSALVATARRPPGPGLNKSVLRKLPAELRVRIYEYTFSTTMVSLTHLATTGAALIQTCQEIRDESLPVLFSHAKFRIHIADYERLHLGRGYIFERLEHMFEREMVEQITQIFIATKVIGSTQTKRAKLPFTLDWEGYLLRQRCTKCNPYYLPHHIADPDARPRRRGNPLRLLPAEDCGGVDEKTTDAQKYESENKAPADWKRRDTDRDWSRLQFARLSHGLACRRARAVVHAETADGKGMWSAMAVWSQGVYY